jgi:uncharacterized membrane protein YeaQ/YmgE (transglycosylase-associated protein family)
MLGLIGWVVFGWIAGSIANYLLPIRDGGKATGLEAIGCGVVGSILGGYYDLLVGGGAYRPAGLVWSVAGAAAAIWLWRAATEGEQK